MIYFLIFLNILMLVSGQVLWKKGIGEVGFQITLKGFIKIAENPYILGGMVIYVIATVLWLYILSQKNLSSVYPLQSLCYVVALFAGWLIFKEKLSINHWIGVSFIVVGAFIINK